MKTGKIKGETKEEEVSLPFPPSFGFDLGQTWKDIPREGYLDGREGGWKAGR